MSNPDNDGEGEQSPHIDGEERAVTYAQAEPAAGRGEASPEPTDSKGAQ